MTNEESIKILEAYRDKLTNSVSNQLDGDIEVFSMAIKALETIPKYKDAYNRGWDDGAKATYEHLKMCEEEQGSDLISRDAVLDAIDKWAKNMGVLIALPANEVTPLFESIHDLPSVNPQPCDDAISRQAVLDVINLNWEYRRNCIRAIEKLPSVNPQEPKWIPVSERLPEKYTYTLWCASSGCVRSDYFNGEFWEDAKKYCYEVIAWMPLPKPYEPQEISDRNMKMWQEIFKAESDHKCHTCKHYTSGENDGSCGSYICKEYSNWESEE